MSGRFAMSCVWFLYFAGLGIFFPFYSLYLRENAGLSGTEVGIVMATVPLVGMVAQPLWGQLADRSGARSAILAPADPGDGARLRGAGAGARIRPAGARHRRAGRGLPPRCCRCRCRSPSRPCAADGPHAFGLVRVWGTIGYLLAVALFPWAVHHLATPASGPPAKPMAAMFPATAACTLAAAAVWPWLPRRGASVLRAGRGEWRVLLRSPPLRRLLAFNLLGYLFLQGPTALFPLFVRDRGGDLTTVGQMWVVMLLLEIPLVALSRAPACAESAPAACSASASSPAACAGWCARSATTSRCSIRSSSCTAWWSPACCSAARSTSR